MVALLSIHSLSIWRNVSLDCRPAEIFERVLNNRKAVKKFNLVIVTLHYMGFKYILNIYIYICIAKVVFCPRNAAIDKYHKIHVCVTMNASQMQWKRAFVLIELHSANMKLNSLWSFFFRRLHCSMLKP